MTFFHKFQNLNNSVSPLKNKVEKIPIENSMIKAFDEIFLTYKKVKAVIYHFQGQSLPKTAIFSGVREMKNSRFEI